MLLEDGVVDPDLPLPGLAPRGEVPLGDGGPVGVYRGAVFEVVRVRPTVVLARELLDLAVPILRYLLMRATTFVQKLVTSISTPPSAVPFSERPIIVP